MEWLFERMIELAAWVAFILGLVFLFDAGYSFVMWVIGFLHQNAEPELLVHAGQAAGAFVLSALACGTLACIDRYVFDMPEPPKKSA